MPLWLIPFNFSFQTYFHDPKGLSTLVSIAGWVTPAGNFLYGMKNREKNRLEPLIFERIFNW